MNKPYFCRNFFVTDWRHKRLKNTIDLLLFLRRTLRWIFRKWVLGVAFGAGLGSPLRLSGKRGLRSAFAPFVTAIAGIWFLMAGWGLGYALTQIWDLIFPYLLSLFFSCVGKVPPAAKSRSATREATRIPSLPQ